MTEFHIIGLGNLCEFVIKDLDNPYIYYGRFSTSGDNKKYMQGFIDYVNQIIKENENLNSNLDDAIEQISKLHSRISDLSRELKKQSEEHYENDFKLQTLEKYYTCPQCAFSSKEFEYLQSLRRIE